MLRLVLGRSGSGKSRFSIDRACEAVASGGQAVLVVPEQFTFESEREMLRRAGPQYSLNVEVLSFSRMVNRILGEYGGLAMHGIDECGRYLLMSRALSQVSDMLRVYGRQSGYPAFIRTMAGMVMEYRMSGITAEDLDGARKKAEDSRLKNKLSDLSLILQSYDAMLGSRFADPADDLGRIAEVLTEHAFFKDKTVIVDSFKGFTSQEKLILRRILSQADEVYITLCTDSLEDGENGLGLFSPVKKTARELITLARLENIPVAAPVRLTETRRFHCKSLAELEKSVFSGSPGCFEEPAPEIHIVSASSVYEEARFAAQEITRLVREDGLRYRDFVIITRGLELYNGILDPVMKKYGVPLFMDTRRSMESHPLVMLVNCLLNILNENFRFEPVFRYLKTGLSGFTAVEVSQLENYAFTWDIRGRESWYNPWKGNPEGFAGESSQADQRSLERLNELRERFTLPLIKLEKDLENSENVRGMLSAIYRYLIGIGADKEVTAQWKSLLESGEPELADEYRQIWDKLMNLFDQAASTMGDEKLPLQKLGELFHLAAASIELAHIPPALDEVTAGDAERIRSGQAKVAFVIGLAEGIFPQTHSPGGVLTDAERETLIALGLELSPPVSQRIVEERFLGYRAFTVASDRIYLTYPRSDAMGHVMRPSHFLSEVKGIFPKCNVTDEAAESSLNGVQNADSAFECMAMNYGTQSALESTLKAYFSSLPAYASRMKALSAAALKRPARIKDKDAARELFGERMHISPSRLESFEQCRFLYFCRYGLRAKTRSRAELAAPQIGTLIHFVLERLLSSLRGRKLWEIDGGELDSLIEKYLDEFAKGFLGGLEDKPKRFVYLFLRLKETVSTLVRRLAKEFSESDFEPVDFELSIRSDGQIEPVSLNLPDGGSIAVEGTVDRVDRMEKEGRVYLRVVDYKTGSKKFNLSDILYGLNLQMFVYLFTLCKNGAERYGTQSPVPAGVLYLPSKKPDVLVGREELKEQEKIDKRVSDEMKMSGLIADLPEVIEAMEHGAKGMFIPAKFVQGGEGGRAVDLRSSSVASLAQFGKLREHIETTLISMAGSLRGGDVAAIPVQGLGYDPCGYCEYRSVCGHEKDDPARYLRKFDTKEVWNQLEGGGEDAEKLDGGAEAGH